ncbi:Abi family protein [Terasakiella brassicae]|nr:Abi family protein [Terasakiella brassicae]
MNTYRRFFNTRTDNETYGLYCWNETLAAELFKLVSSIEITMRNRYHAALSSHYTGIAQGTQQSNDWYNHIGIRQRSALNTIQEHSQYQYPDKTIAALNYGFWMHLYDCRTDVHDNNINWDTIFPNIIIGHRQTAPNPNYWKRRAHQDIFFGRVYAINQLRNRIAHHEPVWKFGPLMEEKRQRRNIVINQVLPAPNTVTEMMQRLNDTHNKGIELLSWFSPSRADDYLRSQSYMEFQRLASLKAIEAYKEMPSKKSYALSYFRKRMNRIMKNQEAVQIYQNGDYKGTFFPF